jgi:dihydroxyacetone kinase-like predicted kinase
MREAMLNTLSGQVTVAVRDTSINDININAGDYLCLLDNDIALTDGDLLQGTKRLIEKMAEKSAAEVIAIYYGQEASEKQAQELADYAKGMFPDTEIEVLNGGQPIYYYIISAE